MPGFQLISENDKYGAPTPGTTSNPPPATPAASVPSAPTKYRKNIRWGEYIPPQAGQQKPALNARSIAAVVPISHLKVSADQREQIESLYNTPSTTSTIVDLTYTLDDPAQLEASAVMAHYGLDVDSLQALANRWSQQWSRHSEAKVDTRRILYLCSSGYDHQQRNTKYDRSPNQDASGSRQRHTGIPFTGCLAHAKLTVRGDKILRIRGHFNHNEGCKTANFTRIPPIPIHPSVYVVALAQLRDGASFSDIRQKNRTLVQAKAYQGIPPDIKSSPYRWIITHNDSRSLYRQYNRMKGISVTESPEINVDDWLDPQSDKFNPTLAHAVFHYSARATRRERVEVAIATDDMKHAAWTYGHESQILLDGTFGLCDSRLLLFIVMTVDESRKGVPVAFLLFSAPTGNKQSSSGYDTAILTKLLKKWAGMLNECARSYGHSGVVFKPLSAITDTDMKERGALIAVFPDIYLLICRFHLRQSWRNHRNKLLKGKRAVYLDLKQRMITLERALTATQTISDARNLLAAERQVMAKLAAEHPQATKKATEHIEYLEGYWTTDNLWPSWSDCGRTVLASMLGTAVDGVIPTTNHLESFNRVLKRTHLRRWQNGGRRLRFDVLVHALIIYILPSIFEERRVHNDQTSRIADLIRLLPGGASLLDKNPGSKAVASVPKVAYLLPDSVRDERGRDLVTNGQISAPTLLPGNVGLTLTSYSSRALAIDTEATIYTIRLGFNGIATCGCGDFIERGGACKHIRGALIILDNIRRQGTNIPAIPIPKSLQDAQKLQATMLTITIRPPPSALPTGKAAEKIEDILAADKSCLDPEGDSDDPEDEQDDDDDNASVATDASSDSDSDSEETDVETDVQKGRRLRASQNIAALGEQAVSRTLFELREMGSRFRDLSEYLDQRVIGLSAQELEDVGKGYGELANLMSKMERVMNLPPPIQSLPPTPPDPSSGSRPSTPTPTPNADEDATPTTPVNPLKRKRKQKEIIGPSPEKAQKRQQSYAVH